VGGSLNVWNSGIYPSSTNDLIAHNAEKALAQVRVLDKEEADSISYHLGYRELLQNTLDLMRLVRSAVIYLIAFIDQEERKKLRDTKGIVPPIITFDYEHYSGSPQTSPL
jgi:hypothetical protein